MPLKDALQRIKNTLNLVQVKGEDNLNKVLACIHLLGICIDALDKQEQPEENNESVQETKAG